MTLLRYLVFIIYTGYFYCGELGVRPCCANRCCGGKNEPKAITNTNLELIDIEERDVIKVKDKEGNEITDEAKKNKIIKDLKENINSDKFSLEIIKKKCPAPQYWNPEAHDVRLPKDKLSKIASKAKVNSDDSNSINEEQEFDTLKNMFNGAMKKLENENSTYEDNNCTKVGYTNDGKQIKDDLGYLYTRYISRYNNVEFIKNIFFDFFNFSEEELKDENKIKKCWQIAKIGTSGDNSNFMINKANNKEYELSFLKKTKAVGGFTFEHKVKNTISVINYNKDLGFDILVNSTAEGRPNIYTNIYYSCRYDKEIDTTFFFIISTYYYKNDVTLGIISGIGNLFGNFSKNNNTDIVYNNVISESDNAFKHLFGSDFSDKLKQNVEEQKELYDSAGKIV